MLDVNQATELEMVFRRNGWGGEDIKDLTEGKKINELLSFIKDQKRVRKELRHLKNSEIKINVSKCKFERTGDCDTLSDTESIDVYFNNDSLKKDVLRVLNTLTERESSFVKFIFGIDCGEEHCLEQLAIEIGLPVSIVHKIVAEAIIKLSQNCRKNFLLEYLT